MHDLVLSGRNVFPPPLPVAQSQTTIDMTDERVTVRVERSRVVHALVRYVNSEWEPGSATGRLSIHESRVSTRGGNEADEIDLEEASATEIMDAIYRASLRRAVTAPPERRMDVVHLEGEAKGKPLPCVAPRRDVARIVHGKPTRYSAGGTSGVRLWRLEFAKCLSKIPKDCELALVKAVKLAGVRIQLGNDLASARSIAERLRGSSKKRAAAARAAAAAEVSQLEIRDRETARQLDELTGSAAHRYGLRRLEQIIYGSPEIERAIFPQEF